MIKQIKYLQNITDKTDYRFKAILYQLSLKRSC